MQDLSGALHLLVSQLGDRIVNTTGGDKPFYENREIPQFDVAMAGRLGMEIQPKNMTDEEKALCKKAIAEYKEIRPVVQLGNIYRLVSPFDHKGLASMMYVSDSKDKAVWYWWKTANFYNQHLPRVRMSGLDPSKLYKLRRIMRTSI